MLALPWRSVPLDPFVPYSIRDVISTLGVCGIIGLVEVLFVALDFILRFVFVSFGLVLKFWTWLRREGAGGYSLLIRSVVSRSMVNLLLVPSSTCTFPHDRPTTNCSCFQCSSSRSFLGIPPSPFRARVYILLCATSGGV